MKRNKEFFQTLTNDFLSPGTSSAANNTKPKNSIDKQIFTFELNNNTSISNSIEHVDCTTMVDRFSMPSSPSNSSSSSSSPNFKSNYSKHNVNKPKLTHLSTNNSPLLIQSSPQSPTITCFKKSSPTSSPSNNSNSSSSDWKWKSEDGIRKKKKSRKDSWVQMASRVVNQEEIKFHHYSHNNVNKKTEESLQVNVLNSCKITEITNEMTIEPPTIVISKPTRIVRTSIKISELLN